MYRRILGVFSLALFLMVGDLAAASNAKTLTQYRALHDVCLQGDVKKIDLQIAKFEQLLAANPKDTLAKAFLGSACALRAKHGKWGPTKLKFLKRGRQNLDEAVATSPSDARVRMVRAMAYSQIPERFGVRQTAIKDFQTIVPLAKKGKDLTNNERQTILYYAALTFREEKMAGAEQLMSLCQKIDPNSEYGRLAK